MILSLWLLIEKAYVFNFAMPVVYQYIDIVIVTMLIQSQPHKKVNNSYRPAIEYRAATRNVNTTLSS